MQLQTLLSFGVLAAGACDCGAVAGRQPASAPGAAAAVSPRQSTRCVVPANGDGSDDGPAIIQAFQDCASDAVIEFSNTTYNVGTVMNTTGLSNVEIDIQGTLLWSTDTDYWLANSLPIGYQNQTSAWFLGGNNITVRGSGYGTLDGNGQVWYDLVQGESNYPNRPHALTIWGATDSVLQGLRFVQSQMWTMTVIHSSNVLLEDVYVSSSSSNGNPARNTDGCNTMFSDGVTLRGWTVDNGDDGVAIKANSTNIVLEDSRLATGQGFAIGSIGQYPGQFETVDGVTVRNVTFDGTNYAAYIKTWTGEQVNYPPNGGGGGLGYIANVQLEDLTLNSVRSQALSISQCTTYSGAAGDCDSSEFQIRDVTVRGLSGSIGSSEAANIQCAAASGGCGPIELDDLDVAGDFICSNVDDAIGFDCTDCPDSSCGGHGS